MTRTEEQIQRAIVELWQHVGSPDVLMHHSPGEALRTKTQRGIAAAMGFRAGWPDLVFITGAGDLAFIEVKAPGAKLSPAQADFHVECIKRGIPWAMVTDAEQALKFWRDCRLLLRDAEIAA